MSEVYSIYFIECVGGGVYIGVTADVPGRFVRHCKGVGALYTKTHPPVRLLFSLPVGTRAEAMRLEKKLKKLRQERKLEWAAANGWDMAGTLQEAATVSW